MLVTPLGITFTLAALLLCTYLTPERLLLMLIILYACTVCFPVQQLFFSNYSFFFPHSVAVVSFWGGGGFPLFSTCCNPTNQNMDNHRVAPVYRWQNRPWFHFASLPRRIPVPDSIDPWNLMQLRHMYQRSSFPNCIYHTKRARKTQSAYQVILWLVVMEV